MLGNRLAAIRKKLGFSQVELAAAMGDRYDQSMISHVETGKAGLVPEGLLKAAEVLGVSVDYLLGATNNPVRQPDVSASEGVETVGMVDIEEISTTLKLGRAVDLDFTPKDVIPFSIKVLKAHGIDHRSCFLVRFQGSSMSPRLPEDCRLFVDKSRRSPGHLRDYLFDTPEGAVVKRLHWHDDLKWILRSSNQTFGGFVPLDESIEIIGEIAWFIGPPEGR